ncbi:amino acid permease [Bordetella avium]|uniref:amino acid permease n=2 Tax=Bordetella avium TaxID=521 RepID=UPI000E18BB67|nr:amino acid permease [Bordetella avium]WQE34414.1 amino acid permease [Bordetella avium]SUV68018.1 glutamate/gamma-aminobutyrate antiporter [Bordetella avium]
MSASALAVNKPSVKKLTMAALVMMNIVALLSFRGLPAEAEYGLSSIFYYLFAALLLPVSLVAFELATGRPERGGVFRWVGEVFGPRMAFLAIFMLWADVTVWLPAALNFAAVSPSVQAAYHIFSQLTVILYLIMCLLGLASAIRLRYRQLGREQPHPIPDGSTGIWVLAGLGFLGSLLAFVLSFIPQDQITVGSPEAYVSILVALALFFLACPFLIYAFKQDDWCTQDSVALFTWEDSELEMAVIPSCVTAQH